MLIEKKIFCSLIWTPTNTTLSINTPSNAHDQKIIMACIFVIFLTTITLVLRVLYQIFMLICYIAIFPKSQNESEVDTQGPRKFMCFFIWWKSYISFWFVFPIHEWDLTTKGFTCKHWAPKSNLKNTLDRFPVRPRHWIVVTPPLDYLNFQPKQRSQILLEAYMLFSHIPAVLCRTYWQPYD